MPISDALEQVSARESNVALVAILQGMASGTKHSEQRKDVAAPEQDRCVPPPRMHVAAEGSDRTAGRAVPIHVLLAEDDELSRRAMVELLKHEGFLVEVAGDGMDALQRFLDQPGDQPIDVVVTDVRLPGQSGYELLQAIDVIRPDTAVIFASGLRREDSGIPHEILVQPRIAYLEKPIDFAMLAAAIRSLAGL